MNIGIDIGGSHIALGLINEENKIILKKEHNWEKEEKNDFLNSIVKYCINAIKEIKNENKNITIQKIGIGYPSANILNGVIYINGMEFNLAERISNEFNIPVYLKNDVKCSGLCEKRIGNLKDYDNCFFIAFGTGVGGAYFYKNQLVKPNKYQGFEIGHMVIEVDGKQCNCGRKGCYEQYASMKAFRSKIEELLGIEKLTSDKMFEIIESKEKQDEVNKIIDEYTNYVSIGICNIIRLFEPDSICMGGSFTYYAPIFMEKIKENIKHTFEGRTIPDILVAKYENDAGIIGASMLESN